jgi:hypothetical protein
MTIRMSRPTTRKDSSSAQFRKRVRSDLIDALRGRRITLDLPWSHDDSEPPLQVTITLDTMVHLSLQTSDRSLLKIRHSAISQQMVMSG